MQSIQDILKTRQTLIHRVKMYLAFASMFIIITSISISTWQEPVQETR